jgi:8-oxo-dGTP diphosphatase
VSAPPILVADGDRPREGGPDRKEVEVAVGVLIRADGAFLLTSRPPGKVYEGYWEFPGGKVEPGESAEAALGRELREELGIEVSESCLAPFVFASHAYDSFHLLMPLYLCRRWEGPVVAREHSALAWVKPDRLADYPMPPADDPLVAWLRDLL